MILNKLLRISVCSATHWRRCLFKNGGSSNTTLQKHSSKAALLRRSSNTALHKAPHLFSNLCLYSQKPLSVLQYITPKFLTVYLFTWGWSNTMGKVQDPTDFLRHSLVWDHGGDSPKGASCEAVEPTEPSKHNTTTCWVDVCGGSQILPLSIGI